MRIFYKYPFIVAISALILSLVNPFSTQAVYNADQSCNLVTTSWLSVPHHAVGVWQTFTPSVDRLTQINLLLKTDGIGDVEVRLLDNTNQELASKKLPEPSADDEATLFVMFDDPSPVTLTAGNLYKIRVDASSGNNSLGWHYKNDCYLPGDAYLDGVKQTYDFNFFTYGYDQDSAPQVTQAPTPTPQPGTSAGTGLPPAAKTSSAIKPPSNLTAVDTPADQGGSVNLTWQASSTATIDGYKIFRSTQQKTGFTNIGQTVKDTLSFIDTQAVTDQSYFYFVRAYKLTAESASSATVSIASKDNIAPAMPKNFKASLSSNGVTFRWNSNAETDLSGYVLNLYPDSTTSQPLQSMAIEKGTIVYEITKTDKPEIQNYYFTLQAKDIAGNLSEKTTRLKARSRLNNQISNLEQADINLPTILIGSGLIIIILSIYLIHRFARQRR